ncbi:flagellin [Clostridium tetanomorphum DSM 665]|nr:flagellin [Clostridium tetanomorphum DSM 665]
MRLNHNVSSLNIYREYSKTLKTNSKALAHISSGQKLLRSGDNPNAVSKSERMRLQIRGLQMAQRNVQDGVSMMQTADGSLSSLNEIVNRVRELVVQSGSGANSPQDKKEIQNEINQMINAYESIVDNTEFNGVKLLKIDSTNSNSNEALDVIKRPMQIGANSGECIDISFKDLSPDKVGVIKIDANGEKHIDENKTLQKLRFIYFLHFLIF